MKNIFSTNKLENHTLETYNLNLDLHTNHPVKDRGSRDGTSYVRIKTVNFEIVSAFHIMRQPYTMEYRQCGHILARANRPTNRHAPTPLGRHPHEINFTPFYAGAFS